MIKPVKILAPNQLIIETDDQIIFQSYKTIVCTVTVPHESNPYTVKQIDITEGQPQSKTTAKHLNKFLKLHTSFDKYQDVPE